MVTKIYTNARNQNYKTYCAWVVELHDGSIYEDGQIYPITTETRGKLISLVEGTRFLFATGLKGRIFGTEEWMIKGAMFKWVKWQDRGWSRINSVDLWEEIVELKDNSKAPEYYYLSENRIEIERVNLVIDKMVAKRKREFRRDFELDLLVV